MAKILAYRADAEAFPADLAGARWLICYAAGEIFCRGKSVKGCAAFLLVVAAPVLIVLGGLASLLYILW